MSKSTLKLELKSAEAVLSKLQSESWRVGDKARDAAIEKFGHHITRAQKAVDALRKQLAKSNPYQVGDQIQRISGADGLPYGNLWQVTSVSDDVKFTARIITSKGKLGQAIERFTAPGDFRRIGRSKLYEVETGKRP